MYSNNIYRYTPSNIFNRPFLFLKDKNALSELNAITIDKADWVEILGTDITQEKALKMLTYIKVTPSGKYFTTPELFEDFMREMRQKGNKIGLFVLLVVLPILLLIIYFLSM